MRGRGIAAAVVVLLAVAVAGCGKSEVDGTALPVAGPSMSAADQAADLVKSSMQRKLDTDPDLSPLHLKVVNVELVNKNGNEYKGIATVRTSKGATHEVPIDVTADGENVIWEAGPGAFLFALQDNPTKPPPPPPAPAAPAPAPAPAGLTPLPMAADGRVYVTTKSGKTRCRISTDEVACQAPFIDAPLVYGQPANGVTFTANGMLTYVVGDLGDIPATTMSYSTYRALSWRVVATSEGTTFTHTGTGRSVFVSITSVQTG